jgi:hypothetical protein
LARLLARLEQLHGTPLAARAAALRTALPACDAVEARAPTGSLLDVASGLRCLDTGGALAGLDRRRGAGDLAFALPLPDGAHWIGTASIEPEGSVALELEIPGDAFDDARALLLPGGSAPGPGVLSGSEALVHARLRPGGGLDIASLVPDEGQGARLFRLKSQLFAGTLLDGTWETAIYLPAAGEPMPRVALAVGYTLREAAVNAVEDFVRSLQDTWPVRRRAFSIGTAGGACLFDLKILPAFAPCYVATDRALVIGWNPASLRKALDGAGATPLGEAGGLVVDLEGIARADALLVEHAGGPDGARPRGYPWRRLRARGRRAGDTVRVQIRLEAEAEA